MFASLLALAMLQNPIVTIPIGPRPPQIERARAPIEESGPAWAATCKDWDEWDKPGPPVRIHGNSYYVGTCGISAILIVGDEGDVLIDGGTDKDGDLIADNIRALGFRMEDVKIILHSHEHHDHVGGIARLQQLSGARLYASPVAARALSTGTATSDDPQAGINPPFPAARVDHVLHDGEQVRLGNIMLVAMATPGHTAGAMSWRWVSCDGGVCRTIVYADSLSPVSRDDYRFTDHPDVVAAFRTSIAKIADSPCDILLTPHPSASDMRTRFQQGKPLLDTDGCKTYANSLTQKLDERLAKESVPPQPAGEGDHPPAGGGATAPPPPPSGVAS